MSGKTIMELDPGSVDITSWFEIQTPDAGLLSSKRYLLSDLLDLAGAGDLDDVLVAGNDAAGIGITELRSIINAVNDFDLTAPTFNGDLGQMHIFTELSTFDQAPLFEISANPAGENAGFKIYDLFGSWVIAMESFQPSSNYRSGAYTAGGVATYIEWFNLATGVNSANISTGDNPNASGESYARMILQNLGFDDVIFQLGTSSNSINGFDMAAGQMFIRIMDYIDISKIKCNGDIAVNDDTKGIIQKSANGHYWRQTVSNAGAATWADLGTSLP